MRLEQTMFLHALRKQNPVLIEAVILLWQQGKIGPDTYIIDVDQTLSNARKLLA
ncbi:YhfX family PLP-dependent enzyme, partial [Yersinia ruckeri]|nr:YhfX family PLP-dependent enzyme [Yersinia ruckeri]